MRSRLFVSSALAFACAELIDAALHETGHGLVAQALRFSPKIYAFYENNPTGDARQTLLILIGGPLASLVLGAIFLVCYRLRAAHYNFGRLLLFWLAWLGIMTFVNYLIVTPFMSAGDTAQIADVLRWSLWERYALMAIGIVLVVALAPLCASTMFALAPESVALETPSGRRRFILGGFYMPLIAGTLLTAVAGIGGHPLDIGLGLLGTFGNIDVVVAAMYAGTYMPAPRLRRSADAQIRVPLVAVALYVALVALYVFVFSHGMPV